VGFAVPFYGKYGVNITTVRAARSPQFRAAAHQASRTYGERVPGAYENACIRGFTGIFGSADTIFPLRAQIAGDLMATG
jgi:hypothetical protein